MVMVSLTIVYQEKHYKNVPENESKAFRKLDLWDLKEEYS